MSRGDNKTGNIRVKVVPITDLQPDPNNANAGTERGLSMLDDSLQQLGAGRSVLADRHGVLMAGNKTHQRAVELGFEEAVVVHTDGRQLVVVQRDDLDLETDPRARRMAISDNRVGEIDLQWSPEMLAAIAKEQPEALAGLWTDDELRALMAATPGEEVEAPEAQIDRAAELQAEWGTARGQIWEIPSKSVPGRCHRLMCGDGTSAGDVARLMGGERADAVVTDPPYGMKLDTSFKFSKGNEAMGINATKGYDPVVGDQQPFDASVILHGFPGIKEMFLFGADYYVDTLPNHGKDGSWMVWDKKNEDLRDVFGLAEFELIWSRHRHKRRVYRILWNGALGTESEDTKRRIHPTQKPARLLVAMLNDYAKGWQLIVDPYAGSGTTMVAAEQTGRICYGCDIEPKYTAVALQRMADMGLDPRLLES